MFAILTMARPAESDDANYYDFDSDLGSHHKAHSANNKGDDNDDQFPAIFQQK